MFNKQSSFKILFLLVFGFAAFNFSAYAQVDKGIGVDAYVKADNLKKAGKYAEALPEYDKALKAEPNNYAYHYGKANCLILKGDTTAGMAALEKTVAVKNDHTKSYEDMARIYDKKKTYDKAIENYESCIKYEPEDKKRFSYKIEIIKILNKAKRYEDIGKYVSLAKTLYPNNFDLLKLEARNNNVLKRYDSVIFYMQQALKLVQGRPAADQAPFYFEMGLAYYNMEQYDKANPMLEKANFGSFRGKVAKMMPAYHTDLASAYAEVYEYAEAEKFLAQAFKIDPKYKRAVDLQKEISSYKIDVSLAIRKLEDSVKVEKNPKKKSDEYCKLCNMQFNALQYDGAMLSAEECLKMNQRNFKVMFLKSVSTFKSGNTNDAIASLDRFSRIPTLSPEFQAKCYFMLGLMYKQAKDNKTATEYFFNKKMIGGFRQAAILEVKKLRGGGESEEEESSSEGQE
jgi:tetratricopeptide (TPR) repeat protein